MAAFDESRRSFLYRLGSLGIIPVVPRDFTGTEPTPPPGQGYVLTSSEGEHLIHFRDQGNVYIKLGSATGSETLAMGSQQVMAGSGIPVHRHLHMDEAFHVVEGGGTVTLNDVRHPFEKGATIFIPKNTWHGFENPDHELLLLWVVTPAGLDGFFREICSPPGVPTKRLTREQVKEIALKYGTEFR